MQLASHSFACIPLGFVSSAAKSNISPSSTLFLRSSGCGTSGLWYAFPRRIRTLNKFSRDQQSLHTAFLYQMLEHCTSKFLAPSMAFAPRGSGSAPAGSLLMQGQAIDAAGFLIVRTDYLHALQEDFVVPLRRRGLPRRRPPATALLGHYPAGLSPASPPQLPGRT
jgi:hypothetical protein